jgi:hypothetical protein
MSRPQKIHKPIKGAFNNILASIAMGSGKGKNAAQRLQDTPIKASQPTRKKKGL